MRTRGIAFALAGLMAVSCFLPDVEFDPTVGKAGAGRGGSGSAGAGAGGKAGGGGTAGTGGSGGTGGGAEAGAAGADQGDAIEEACGEYCTTYFMACEGEVANTYDDLTDCAVTCTSSGWPLGTFEESNSISCRLIHAGRALAGAKDPHCFHSAEVPSKGICD